MNFMFLDENIYNQDLSNLINKYEFDEPDKDNYINPEIIMNNYNEIKKNSNYNIKEIDKIYKDHEVLLEYKNNINKNHGNNTLILSILNNHNKIIELNELSTKYNQLFNELYDTWINNYYNPKLIEIDNQIKTTMNSLNKYHEFFKNINNIINENNQNSNKNICSICFENEVDMCAIPCGHTCCNKCIISNNVNIYNRNKCLNCRNNIQQYIKLYFSI
jgi:hypothetical protein